MKKLTKEQVFEIQKLCSIASQRNFINIHEFSEALGSAIDSKDKFTFKHSEQVAVISCMLALTLGFPGYAADIIHVAGHLHDIGKIFIPESILLKPDKLTSEEFEIIKRHPEYGAKILSRVNFCIKSGICEMVLYHHERWNGSGYPKGLREKDIPLGARIIAVADVLSALLQERPYRKAFSWDEAMEEITKNSGILFDPDVVNALIEVEGKVKTWIGLI
ncbi:HD-GYP domain-containing protein [Thermodesulfovibrio sp. 3462-1]|uniref:HD-GYP domain-containing protein n=1 Tax=Thermodesulfovibrio obliviosus TaxID=3118332 RepID=A0AAU8H249_9BACT